MQKRWTFLKKDIHRIDALAQELKIHRSLCSILVQRGLDTFDKAKQFFRPQISDLHNPFSMKDMQKAVDRLLHAFNHQQKILVFGDYDVDGTTSVACMFQFLSSVYDPSLLDYYIPHRYREGYGVSKQGIEFAKANGFTLIISLDCGIKSVELIAYAKELGIEFIICDHHLLSLFLIPSKKIVLIHIKNYVAVG
jgi:single-stranded-DNA-specific exonuclease